MTRATMRTMLRRRLHETTADNWSDADLNALLEAGLHQVQKEVMKYDAAAFMYIDEAPLQANQEFYPLPDGFWYELVVKIKTSASATTYTTLTRGAYDADQNRNSTLERVYDIRGRFITFMANPDYSVNPGYMIQYVPTLSLGADSTVPAIHKGLHTAVVLWAHLIALGETPESATDTAGVLKAMLDDIPLYYKRGGEAPRLRLDAGGPYY